MQKKTSGKPDIGICKLTGTSGPYVKSHIIPKALTRPEQRGMSFVTVDGEARPGRQFDSWYDYELVTQAGEDILTELDTYAISELRRLKLVWQSWGPMLELCTPETHFFPQTPNGVRKIIFEDGGKMRLFFLSILWRAAASKRTEFRQVQIKPSDLRRLRACIRDHKQPKDWLFYPITLTQISTRGLIHIQAPVKQRKLPFTVAGHTSGTHDIFRFFMDGLIVHFHMPIPFQQLDGLWPMLVGPAEGTVLSLVTWEGSRHILDLLDTVEASESAFPGRVLSALERSRSSLAWVPPV